jgi:hypothetical protein
METLTLLLERNKCHSSRQITLLTVPENLTTLLDILTTHKCLGEIGVQELPVKGMLAVHTMRVLNGLANIALSASMARSVLALGALHFPPHLSIFLNTHRASGDFLNGGCSSRHCRLGN